MTTFADRLAAAVRWRREVRRTKARQLAETRHDRHQVWFGEPRLWHRAWWVVADVFDHAWGKGLLWGLFLFALMAGFGSIDYIRSADQLVEETVIVSVEVSATETATCRGWLGPVTRPAVIITNRVTSPRPGLPDEVLTYDCEAYGAQVGDVVPMVRPEGVVEGEVWTYPIRSWEEVFTFALLGWWPFSFPLIAFVMATAWYWLQDEIRATAFYARWTERNREREWAEWRKEFRPTQGRERGGGTAGGG